MKRIAILTALILASVSAFGQAARVDIPLLTSGPSVPITGGPLPQALWVANSAAYLCTHPSATLAACQAAPITTYTDSTEGTTCPTATPLVQLPGNTCTAATGTTANVGFWYGGGVFDYWIVSSYGTYGPFSGNSSNSALPSSCGNPTGIPCGGTGATTAAAALANLGGAALTGAAFTGPVSAPSINNIQYANTFTGATASEKIIACLAAAGNGTCDATGLTGVQPMDATVEIGASGAIQSLILSPNTVFEPTGPSTPPIMFLVDHNGAFNGASISFPVFATAYSGEAVAVTDTVGFLQNFSIRHIRVDGSAQSNQAYGLYVAPSGGSYAQLESIDDVSINNVGNSIGGASVYIYVINGASSYVNGLKWTNFTIGNSNGGPGLVLNAPSGTLGITGNHFVTYDYDGGGCAIQYLGSSQIGGNDFSGHLWDTTTPICNSNPNASGNTFTGQMDNPYTDPNSFPTSNIYSLPPNVYNLPGGVTSHVNSSQTINAPSLSLVDSSTGDWKHVFSHSDFSVSTGTLKINLPAAKRWSYSLQTYRILMYQYGINAVGEILVSGYNSSGGSWEQGAVSISGDVPITSVRLADDGTYNCILLGTISTVWSDLTFSVDVLAANNAFGTGWGTGWSSAFLSSEAGITVTQTPTISTPIYGNLTNSNGTVFPSAALTYQQVNSGLHPVFAPTIPGTGADLMTGPATSTTGDFVKFGDTVGTQADAALAVTAVPQKVNTCGTTSTCSNTSQASPRIVWGTVALSGGTITVGSMTAWTSTSTFGCTCTDTSTTAASCTVQNTSSSSITIKGTSTDTVTYMCVGN